MSRHRTRKSNPVVRELGHEPTTKIGKGHFLARPRVMIVTLWDRRGVKAFKRVCHATKIHQIPVRTNDGEEVIPLVFRCTGPTDALEHLVECDFLQKWHWLEKISLARGSGAGEKPTRKPRPMMVLPEITFTDSDGVEHTLPPDDELRQHNRHAGASEIERHQHQCETLDKAQQQATNAASLWWKQNGLPVPIGNIGKDGKVM